MKTRKPKTKIITGCNDCPFCVYDSTHAECGCNLDLTISLQEPPITPVNCPLKTQPIIVSYES